jgi:hypothetical protein
MNNHFFAFETRTRVMHPLRALSKALTDQTSALVFVRHRLVFSTNDLLLDAEFLKDTLLTEDFRITHSSLKLWVPDFLLEGIPIASLVSQPEEVRNYTNIRVL